MRAAADGDAGEKHEAVHHDRLGPEQAVMSEEQLKARHRLAAPAGERDMRHELVAIGRQAGPYHRRFDLVAQVLQGRREPHPRPQEPYALAVAEMADAGEVHFESRRPQAPKRQVDVGGDARIDVADETQGQVQVFRRHPAQIGQAAEQDREALARFRGQRDTDEQAHGGKAPELPRRPDAVSRHFRHRGVGRQGKNRRAVDGRRPLRIGSRPAQV